MNAPCFGCREWRRLPRLVSQAMLAGLALATLAVGGCAATAYLGQSIDGQLELLRSAQPIDKLIANPETPPALRVRLEKALAIREFASRKLGLPDNGSYRRYADLKRPFVVWNVFAAPELSVRLKESCFPIAGCVGYRGYFSEEAATRAADELHTQGYDVYVAGVPAYSTLGYFDDPVLSSFINYAEADIARLLFHELAHQVAYAAGDTAFNESFATAVEREGLRRYFANTTPAIVVLQAKAALRRDAFAALVTSARQQLAQAFADAPADGARRAAKEKLLDQLKKKYAELRTGEWRDYAGYDSWFASGLNNAKLASVAVYSARVPAFEELLRRRGGDLTAFYDDVRELARLPKAERNAVLSAAAPGGDATQTGTSE